MGLTLGFLFPALDFDLRGLGFLFPALDLDSRGLGRPGSLLLQLCTTSGSYGSNARKTSKTKGTQLTLALLLLGQGIDPGGLSHLEGLV